MSEFIDKLLPAPVEGGFKMNDHWIWCGSPIHGEDGRYHLFASRWPKAYPMHPGWLFHSQVVRAAATSPAGPYIFEEVVLERREPFYFDGQATHNPAIRKFKDTYYLFYTGVTYCFPPPSREELPQAGDPLYHEVWLNKRVGIATSKSIFGPWKRSDEPIAFPRSGKWDSAIISNPAPCILPDGRTYLIYKSTERSPGPVIGPGCRRHKPFKLGLLYADHPRGPYRRFVDKPVFPAKDMDGSVEDPFLWHDGERFNILMKDMDGSLCGERHGGIHALSEDAIRWFMSKAKRAYSRNVLWDDGQTRTMGNLERPQLLFEDGKPTHLFAATANGEGDFHGDSTWNMVIPMKG